MHSTLFEPDMRGLGFPPRESSQADGEYFREQYSPKPSPFANGQADPDADVRPLRDEVDDLIFDLFDVRTSRDLVRHFYRTVGRAETDDARPDEGQAAVE